ncbi:MAG: hypothetical protein GY937_20115 [bacterium]|nr:hypothetical protein [bacterium]
MKVNWGDIPEGGGNVIVPDGWYLVKVQNIDLGWSSAQDEMWIFWYVIQPDDRAHKYVGQKIRDSIAFSPKGLGRCKTVLTRLGCPGLTAWECDETVADDTFHSRYSNFLVGKTVHIEVFQDSYEKNGKTVRCNRVTFDGYRMTNEGAQERSETKAGSPGIFGNPGDLAPPQQKEIPLNELPF